MGTRDQAAALLEQLTARVEALGLKLKAEKTRLTHLDEGFVFLGQKMRMSGSSWNFGGGLQVN